jgi:DNA repair exonuclease SbcCD nuclease subunit
MGARLLAIGDVHLGRRPTRLPAFLEEHGIGAAQLTPEAALRTAVERAIDESVDAVVFAGDLVESRNARFEALRPLEAAVRRLAEADIGVFAVAGNHDVEALPRLARLIPEFTLLGEGGQWQSVTLRRRGSDVAELIGWSFPSTEVHESPLPALRSGQLVSPTSGLPRIGLLHADLDAAGGPYAPVRRSELDALPLDGWLLGHIHRPTLGPGPRPVGYLGSLQGLDPSETGLHGPWLVQARGPGRIDLEQLPLAPLHWDQCEVDVSDLGSVDDLDAELGAALLRCARAQRAAGGQASVIGVRPRLVGATDRSRELRRALASDQLDELARDLDGTLVFVDRLIDETRARLDLAAQAAGADPPALLARKLLALERGGEEAATLIRNLRRELLREVEDPRWAALEDGGERLSDSAIGEQLRQVARDALVELLAQKERRPEAAGEGV